MSKRLLYLIIFCIVVISTSLALTFSYNKKNDKNNIEMYPNSSSEEIYELVSDEIYISKFEVSYDELIGKWVVYFVLKNNTDKDIPLDDYLVLVYGNNGKILREYYKGLNPVINAKKENKYTYILSFDGSLVEKVEIVKNSEYLFDQENYG